MILFLLTSLALAQSTATLTITCTVVDSNHLDPATLPVTINGTPVEVWTALSNGSQSEMTVSPCEGCPQVRYDDVPGYDWSDYPYPPKASEPGLQLPTLPEPSVETIHQDEPLSSPTTS